MIHGPFYNSGNRRDLDDSQRLTVTLATSNASLVLVLLDVDLRALGLVVHNLSLDGHLGQIGGSKGHLGAIDQESNRKLHGIALLGVETVHEDGVANLDLS